MCVCMCVCVCVCVVCGACVRVYVNNKILRSPVSQVNIRGGYKCVDAKSKNEK